MANLDLSTVELVSTLRAAPQNGSPSSQDYNDSWTEALADLAALSGFVNDIVIPLFNGLSAAILPNPNGTPQGIEGRFIFSDTTDLTPLFFDTLASQPLSLADSLRILQGIIQTVQISIGTLNVEVTALQTQLSATNQNDIAQALQNFAASLQSLSSQTVANTQALATIPIMETNGTINPVQSQLNLKNGNGITLTNFAGDVTIDGVLIKTNSTPNSTQTLLNLAAGTNISIVEAAGTVTISATGGGGGVGSLNGETGSVSIVSNAGSIAVTTPTGSTINLEVSSVTESMLSLSNVTTDDVSTTKHGFAPRAPNDATKFLDGTGVYSAQYVICGYQDGTFTASQKIIAYPVDRSVNFAANFSGSQATLQIAATASTVFTVKKNGTTIGTITFGIGGTVGTFATTGGVSQSLVSTDVFNIVAPASPDATAAGLGFSLAGTR